MEPAGPDALLADALRAAMAHARAGRAEVAEAILADILVSAPDQHDALQLRGMIARRRKDHEAAIVWFRRSLRANPLQPHVLNNLGNSLLDLARPGEAIAAYRQALALQPGHPDAGVNLGLALLAEGQTGAARHALEDVIRRAPDDARGWAGLGQCLSAAGGYAAAIDAFHTALARRPGHVPTLHNLAVALRLSGNAESALPILRDCVAANPAAPEIRYNLGHCYQDLGRIDEAATAYRAAIALRPADRAVHDSLNRMLWQHGRTDDWLASYAEALRACPDDPGLLADLAQRLVQASRAQEALALLGPVVARGSGGAELRHRLAQAYWSGGRAQEALAQWAAALMLDPSYAPAAREAARAWIIAGRPADALNLLQPLLAADPADQQALALQALGWRFTQDARAEALDDPRFVSVAMLTPPTGEVAAFNARLDAVLTPLHTARQHPLEQTLRGGTQTSDDLFARDLPEIAGVRSMIADGVQRYIDALPDDPDHPFLRRKAGGFAFSGSWSVRLRRSGFHENHIHPEGWISACYYVALPDAVNSGEQGWLTLGETGLRLGMRERVLRRVRPEVGMLVLFPSYFYHGTLPFEDAGHRTTIAFDVVPGL
ncbi:tetratricopeptide repeat protein [Sphingomonas hengshuiensis]|uniref:tetratricopeptide repeat protein n=1 Tax=Sphingomonas hengshuiensis TaxID=1609977 RepID=UPI00069739C3|nr:tetratricopeptide repeat protein [Sphingomonas hengshuiensis]